MNIVFTLFYAKSSRKPALLAMIKGQVSIPIMYKLVMITICQPTHKPIYRGQEDFSFFVVKRINSTQ